MRLGIIHRRRARDRVGGPPPVLVTVPSPGVYINKTESGKDKQTAARVHEEREREIDDDGKASDETAAELI